MTTPYEALAALAEREHALVAAGRLEDLDGLAAERDALVAGLPPQAPVSARPALVRSAALQAATTDALERSARRAQAELRSLGRGRHATRAYGRAA